MPIDLALRTWVPVLVWLFAGLMPVLVISMVKWDGAERGRRGIGRRPQPSASSAVSALEDTPTAAGADRSPSTEPDH